MKKNREKWLTAGSTIALILITLICIFFFPFGTGKDKKDIQENTTAADEKTEIIPEKTAPETGLAYETAKDGEIDFITLQKENPDIFAWIYLPDTDIDYPVVQSEEADDYYEDHNAYGEESQSGAIYTELANLKNMCDFNTVLHGKAENETQVKGLFTDLYQFANPDFFESHKNIYIFLPDNVLTYEIFSAYEREDTSLIRTYDFTYIAGCEQFLEDMYDTREMGKNLREGWEEVTPYHFLITLTTRDEQDPDKQYIVIGALTGDAAGKIDRVVTE